MIVHREAVFVVHYGIVISIAEKSCFKVVFLTTRRLAAGEGAAHVCVCVCVNKRSIFDVRMT